MFERLLNINPGARKSALLLGPRGTGKTHWLKHHLSHALVFNLLKSETFNRLLANPSSLENLIAPDFKHWVVIDEIQKIPPLLDEVHRLIEDKGYKFLLTGSSARKLKQGAANLLAGRALKYKMHPLTVQEMGGNFSISKALQYGMLPEVYQVEDPLHYLETYVKTYLQEEVLQEGILRNLSEFSRFLEVASFSQGEILNMSHIAREAGIKQKTVSSYYQIVEDLLIGFKLPVFIKRAQRQLIAHPKFFYFDVGVYRVLRPMGPLDSPHQVDGHALETLVIQHMRALNDYLRLGLDFFYWRTRNNVEVDFVAYGERGLFAFEIKRKKRIQGSDLRGLRTFMKDYPMAKGYVFYGGDLAEYYDNINVLPIEQGLQSLPDIFGK